eukprot:Polyplicarium_translucidae@DN3439_c0_g1_i1.p1
MHRETSSGKTRSPRSAAMWRAGVDCVPKQQRRTEDMLDAVAIFTKGGVVLWSFYFVQQNSVTINDMICTVLLEDRITPRWRLISLSLSCSLSGTRSNVSLCRWDTNTLA